MIPKSCAYCYELFETGENPISREAWGEVHEDCALEIDIEEQDAHNEQKKA